MTGIKHFFQKTHQKFQQLRGKVAEMKRTREITIERATLPSPPPKEHHQRMELVVSASTMAKFVAITIVLLLVAAFFYRIGDILILFFVSLLFAAALDPMVDLLERRKVPRSLGVIIIYLLVLFAIGLLVSRLVPIIAKELGELADKVQDFITNIIQGKIELPAFMERFRPAIKNFFEGVDVGQLVDYKKFLTDLASNLKDVAGSVFKSVLVIFNGFFNMILVLVITFLMIVDERGIDKFILSLFPGRYSDYIHQKSEAIKEKMGYWLRGQVVLCIVVGLLVYLGLFAVGLFTKPVEYAATIALVAGFTELIPYVGPFIAWLVALPIVANQSLVLIIWMTVVMYIVQVLENNVIVPVVMKRAVGISPIFVMFAMLVGFEYLGVLGMILGVPVATAVSIFVKDYTEKEK